MTVRHGATGGPRGGRVRRDNVMRYLGHTGQAVGEDLAGRIDAAIARCEEILDPRWVWRAFHLAPQDASGARAVEGTALALGGASMGEYLAGADGVALLAVTLGPACDRELAALGARDPLGQVVFDAAATDLVEWGADACEDQVRAWAREHGLSCGSRFSPGYGDLPLSLQPVFLSVLDAGRRLGLTASDGFLLVPTKSVTALIALRPSGDGRPDAAAGERDAGLGCASCGLRGSCGLRARGLTCSGARRANEDPHV